MLSAFAALLLAKASSASAEDDPVTHRKSQLDDASTRAGVVNKAATAIAKNGGALAEFYNQNKGDMGTIGKALVKSTVNAMPTIQSAASKIGKVAGPAGQILSFESDFLQNRADGHSVPYSGARAAVGVTSAMAGGAVGGVVGAPISVVVGGASGMMAPVVTPMVEGGFVVGGAYLGKAGGLTAFDSVSARLQASYATAENSYVPGQAFDLNMKSAGFTTNQASIAGSQSNIFQYNMPSLAPQAGDHRIDACVLANDRSCSSRFRLFL